MSRKNRHPICAESSDEDNMNDFDADVNECENEDPHDRDAPAAASSSSSSSSTLSLSSHRHNDNDKKRKRIVDPIPDDDDDDDEQEEDDDDDEEEDADEGDEMADTNDRTMYQQSLNMDDRSSACRAIKGYINSNQVLLTDVRNPTGKERRCVILEFMRKAVVGVKREIAKSKMTWDTWILKVEVYASMQRYITRLMMNDSFKWKPTLDEIRVIFTQHEDEFANDAGNGISTQKDDGRDYDDDEHEDDETQSEADWVAGDDEPIPIEDEDEYANRPRLKKGEKVNSKKSHSDIKQHNKAARRGHQRSIDADDDKMYDREEEDDDGVASDVPVSTLDFAAATLPKAKSAAFNESHPKAFKSEATTSDAHQWVKKKSAIAPVVEPTASVKPKPKPKPKVAKPVVAEEESADEADDGEGDEQQPGKRKVARKISTYVDYDNKVNYDEMTYDIGVAFISAGVEYQVTYIGADVHISDAPPGWKTTLKKNRINSVKNSKYINEEANENTADRYSTCLVIPESKLDTKLVYVHFLLSDGYKPCKVTAKHTRKMWNALLREPKKSSHDLALKHNNLHRYADSRGRDIVRMIFNEKHLSDINAAIEKSEKSSTDVVVKPMLVKKQPLKEAAQPSAVSSSKTPAATIDLPSKRAKVSGAGAYGMTIPNALLNCMFAHNFENSHIDMRTNSDRLQRFGRQFEDVYKSCENDANPSESALVKLAQTLNAPGVNLMSFAMNLVFLTSPTYVDKLEILLAKK